MPPLPEPTIDHPIIDAHQHFWDLGQNSYPWLFSSEPSIVGDPAPIRRDYLPADYLADLGPYRLSGSVHLDGGFDPSDPVGETRFVQGIAERHGVPNAIVGGVALDREDAEGTIEAHLAASPLVRGVRQIVAWHPERRLTYVSDPQMMRGVVWRRNFALLARHGLSFDLQLYPSQMADAARLAGDNPDVPIILDQAGMPVGFQNGVPADWRAGMAALAAHPNVSVKLSGFGMLHPRWTAEELRPVIRETVELFGPERVMFASNYPVDKLFRPLADIIEATAAALADLGGEDRCRIFADNARRIYRMHIQDTTNEDGFFR